MSKDQKMKKDAKKAPSTNLNKKVSAYQTDKSSSSVSDTSVKKKSK
ncbi:hypothetical protein GCM10027037_18350 [Mucilaginibacter koreensis]